MGLPKSSFSFLFCLEQTVFLSWGASISMAGQWDRQSEASDTDTRAQSPMQTQAQHVVQGFVSFC